MKFFSLFVAMFLVVTGCGTGLYQYHSVDTEENNQHTRTFPIYVDKSFTPKEVATINQVVEDWNHVLNGYMTIRVEPVKIDHNDFKSMIPLLLTVKQTHEGLIMIGADHDDEIISDDLEGDNGTLAFVNNLGDRAHMLAVVRDRIGYKNLHKILLHEFGHSLGANHTNAVGLMYPYYGYLQTDCVDKITALQVANYYHLDINHMNYCSTPNLP